MIAASPAGRMSATVAQPQALHELVATVRSTTSPGDRLHATVAREQLDAWEAKSLYYRPRVKLAGQWVPASELHGPVEIEEPEIGQHTGGFSFGLAGRKWSIAATEKVWARVPVEIYLDHGPAGHVIEGRDTAVWEEGVWEEGVWQGETPDYRGYVLARPSQEPGLVPIVRVHCGDEAAAWERRELCDELAPKSGLTRGQVIAALAAGIGLPVDVPDGARYDKPLQAARKRLFQLLPDFVEPEGWQLEVRDGTLVAWNPRLKLAPLPPDWEWERGDCLEVVPVAPEEAPSRWVIHATATIDVDEQGVETITTRVEVKELYAPLVALEQQNSDGSITSTGLSSSPSALHTTSLVIFKEVRRGERVLETQQLEYGFYARSAARLVTNTSGPGTAGGGFNYQSVNILEDGRFVWESRERFRLIGQRKTVFTYDANKDRTGARIQEQRWQRGGTKGVRNVGDTATATSVIDAYVYDDDQSYALSIEGWGEHQEIVETLHYDGAGRGDGSVQELFRRQAVKSHVSGPNQNTSYYVLYDGTGQTEIVANRRLAQRKTIAKALTSDGLVAGETETVSEYRAPVKADGDMDWGGHQSNAKEQAFGVVRSESKLYSQRREGQAEIEAFPAEGGREVNLILGHLPITEYTSSVWTRIATQPLELVIEDELAESWFGWQRETLSHEHVQSLAEARAVIRRRRQRALSPKADVVRLDNGLVRRGDTVLLRAHEEGIEGRYLITGKRRVWGDASDPTPRATYRLEAWGEVA